MPRSLWKGTISFGLVTIPAELHTAVRAARPKFRLLHAKDLSPIEYRKVCSRDGKPVSWDDLVKGYEYEPGQFVALTKDDLETAALEKSRVIHVLDFVKASEVDPRYFDVPYYVMPGKGAEIAYAVLRDALGSSGKLGISRVMLREVQHLAALGVAGDLLVLTLMRFADELVDSSDFHVPQSKSARPKEVQLAGTLIDSLTASWSPDRYEDIYVKNLMQVINSKMKGARPRLKSPDRKAPDNVIDLMERLKASLEKTSPERSRKAAAPAKTTRKKTKARRRVS
jgi:DNA end-binding protein Ku